MHLKDEDLLEPDESALEHLKACELCQERFQHLMDIRKTVQQLPDINMPENGGWQNIKQSYQEQKYNTSLQQERKKTRLWQRITVGIAATFALMTVFGITQYSINWRAEQKAQLIAEFIAENNAQQQQLVSFYKVQKLSQYELANIQMNLDAIDKQLQLLYLNNGNENEKLVLWRKRQALLNVALNDVKQTQIIKI